MEPAYTLKTRSTTTTRRSLSKEAGLRACSSSLGVIPSLEPVKSSRAFLKTVHNSPLGGPHLLTATYIRMLKSTLERSLIVSSNTVFEIDVSVQAGVVDRKPKIR